MATEEAEQLLKKKNTTTNKKKKKKARKDKWGQPLPAETADEAEQAELTEEVPQSGGGGDGGGGEETYETSKVVASGLPYSTTEEEIRDLFEEYGPVQLIQLSRFPDSGNFRGLAFITFENEEVATNSLKLDGTQMGTRYIKVERCRIGSKRKRKSEFSTDPEKADGNLSAYIGNLSWDVTEEDIRECFKESKIATIRFALDKETGMSRGFCHVDFVDDVSLEQAVQKNQMKLHGRPIKIAYAVSNRN